MFFLIGLIILGAGAVPLIRALATRKQLEDEVAQQRIKRGTVISAATLLLVIVLNIIKGYYTDLLWFESLGFSARYWTELGVRIALFVVGGLIAFLAVYSIVRRAASRLWPDHRIVAPLAVSVLAGIIFGLFSSAIWQQFLMFINRSTSEVTEPLFGLPVHVYLFVVPFFGSLVGWSIGLTVVCIIVAGGAMSIDRSRGSQRNDVDTYETQGEQHPRMFRGLLFSLLSVLAVFLAANEILSVFRLLSSQGGVVAGAGWLDANVRVVARLTGAGLFVLTAVGLMVGAMSKSFASKVFGLKEGRVTARAVIAPGILIGSLVIVHAIVPAVFNALIVKPNEISVERQYIERSIKFTRAGFGLTDSVVQPQSYEVGNDITPQILERNKATLDNVRLWDWRALQDNLREQQEIRLYYSFGDVDIDRYVIDGSYRQVMLAVRELDKSELAEQSQTWVSRRLKYTHGYGLAMTPVHELLEDGRPKLLIRNIPAEVRAEGLTLTRPEVYYGEMTTDHVYLNTTEQEFDHPEGDENVYTTYEGSGGVVLNSLFNRFVFAWRFKDYQLLFSRYFTDESRVLYDRHIRSRVEKIAPFLEYDNDPYPVITDDGRIVYIIDAYTVASSYPYSERYAGVYQQFLGANYLRNSIKVVIDAYHGDVTYYVVDPTDVVGNTYRNMFPELFRGFEAMPADIRRHIRYPVGLITTQAEVYSTYHMDDPEAFYQREDVWEFATERYRDDFERVAPYYILTEFPETGRVEFVNILPFTPKNKNVINAWIAGRSDAPSYGELVVFTFPKGVEVLGPRQIEARIDQNTTMSRELSLWGQRGSSVIRGNLLAIPLFDSDKLFLLFVEPIFLQADNASLPELKRVAVADQSNVVWSEQFDDAIDALVAGRMPTNAEAAIAVADGVSAQASIPIRDTISAAVDAFDTLASRLRNGQYADAGAALERLSSVIEDLRAAATSEATGTQP